MPGLIWMGRLTRWSRIFRIHNLHGGSKGLGNRVWKITGTGPDFVTLATVAPDGEMGFPGNLNVSCTYMLNGDGTLIIRLEAVTDKPTVCNLLHHSYFNLDDGGEGISSIIS